MKTEFDVFLSHNLQDKLWVRELFNFLRSLGLSVFFDEDSIEYGEHLLRAIESGVEDSERIILVITPAFLSSEWVYLESSIAVSSDLNASRKKIIPILLKPVDESKISHSIRLLNRADFTSESSRRIGFKKLLSQLGIENSEDREIPISLLDPDYQSNRQIYKATLIKHAEQLVTDPDSTQEILKNCLDRFRLEPKDVKDIDVEVIGAELSTRLSSIKKIIGSTPLKKISVEEVNKINKAVAELSKFGEDLEKAKGKTFTFILVGKTGVGKSSTINSLIDESVAPVGHFRPCTTEVKTHETDLHGATIRVIDTPGLCDDLPEVGNDDKYIELIHQKIKSPLDVVLFVAKLDDSRVDASEKRGLRLITKAFGESFWKKAVIVFTRADAVSDSDFEYYLKERTQLIHEELSALALSDSVVRSIPSVAVDNTNFDAVNPDGEDLIAKFYVTVFNRAHENSRNVLLLSTSHVLEKKGISPLRLAGETALAGVAGFISTAPLAALAAHILGVGALSYGTAVSGSGAVVLTGLFAFSNPVGWALILGTSAVTGGFLYKTVKSH